jgi:hypothetical protein
MAQNFPCFFPFFENWPARSMQAQSRSAGMVCTQNLVLWAFFEKQKIRLLANRQKRQFSMACFTRPISADFARGKRQFGRIGLF